jgi:hypothetical protein
MLKGLIEEANTWPRKTLTYAPECCFFIRNAHIFSDLEEDLWGNSPVHLRG